MPNTTPSPDSPSPDSPPFAVGVPLPADFPLTPTLQDLYALDRSLAQQEQNLASQLQAIRAQRQSLQRVLQLLDNPAPDPSSPPPANSAQPPAPVATNQSAPAPAQPTGPSVPSPTPVPPQPNSAPSSPATIAPKSPPKPAPRSTRQPPWRRYLQPAYSHLSLPETITQVLDSQPDRAFAIAEITDLMFEGLPLETSMQAHDRVSHVLADGARRGQWLRPKLGHYQSLGFRQDGTGQAG